MSEPILPPQMSDQDVQHRAAVLMADRSFRDVFRRIKWDIFKEWTNANSGAARDDLHAELRALGRLEGKLGELASGAEISKRKEEAKRRRAAVREGG